MTTTITTTPVPTATGTISLISVSPSRGSCGEEDTWVLGREGNGSRPGEGAGELREHGEVGVKLDTLKPTDAQGEQCPLVLQATELALNGGAALVELAPAQRLARDQRMLLRPPAQRRSCAGTG